MKINQNVLAKNISEFEIGEEISIAQIKEVMRIYNALLANHHKPSEVLAMLEKYVGKKAER